MSEKLDGVRCIWTGKELITRNGTILRPPVFFTRAFPNSCLDGELFAGRNNFRRVIQVATDGEERDWLELSFWVFDAPRLNLQYSQRYSVREYYLDDQSDHSWPWKRVHKVGRAQGSQERRTRESRTSHRRTAGYALITQGGEGLVLRNPRSFYETKRGWAALKMRNYIDSEAVVIKNNDGQSIDVEINGQPMRITKLMPAAEAAKKGQKLLLKYFKVCETSRLPYRPTAIRISPNI